MALENVQYRQGSTVDWSGLTSKIADQVTDIGARRQKTKEELDALRDQTQSIVNQPLGLEKQSLNTFVLDSANKVRNYSVELNKKLKAGEITPVDYKKTLSNINEYWTTFSGEVKGADDRFKLFEERMQPGENGLPEASDFETELYSMYADMADLNNKTMILGADGAMHLAKIGPDGQQEGELLDIRDFARPENMQSNRMNVPSAVQNMISDWASVDLWTMLGRGGEKTITSVKNQPDYKLMKVRTADALASNPKAEVSILVDNGVIKQANYYQSDSQKEQLFEELVATTKAQYAAAGKEFTDKDLKDIELSFIKVGKDQNGMINPILTDEQKAKAKERIEQEIDMQIETKINASAPQQWASSMGGGGSGDEKAPPRFDTYEVIRDAFVLSKTDRKRSEEMLNNAAGGDYKFVWSQGGLNVYGWDADNGRWAMEEPKIKGAKTGEEIARVFYGTTGGTEAAAIEKLNVEREAYKKAKGGNTTKETPKTISAKEVATKAKAAGYSPEEYKKLLIAKGIKII